MTVHFVDEGVDTGPIILQRAIELPGARRGRRGPRRRLRPIEHELLPEAVRLIARGAVSFDPAETRGGVVAGADRIRRSGPRLQYARPVEAAPALARG